MPCLLHVFLSVCIHHQSMHCRSCTMCIIDGGLSKKLMTYCALEYK
uniref:PCP1pri n=1 Tax=Flaveria pringlei TaxID=4226 RepID=O65807_FLAPR|nr:PCP1pri [Flaveria pringlei]